MALKACGMDDSRLQDYLDRALGRRDRAEVEAHLASCPGCAREVELFRLLTARLAALPLFAPDPDFDRIVLSAVLPARRRVLGVSPLGWAAAAYFVFTLGLLGVALVMAGAPVSGGPLGVLRWAGQGALHNLAAVTAAAAVAWEFLRGIAGPLGGLAVHLLQVPLRVFSVSLETPDGRFYFALAVCTALAFFLIARRTPEGGVRHARIRV